MISKVKNYLSLIKFSHTVFALPFAVIGFVLGISEPGQHYNGTLFFKVVLCMVFARTAAMAFNRFADRHLDSLNERTQVREIPQGKISPLAAISLVIASSAAFIITTYFINRLCFYLSPVALAIVLGYSITKRFTWLCHLILGIGLSLAPIGAYLAVTGIFDWAPLYFSFAVICWVSGFDIIYSLQDEDFDRSSNLYSMPVAFGKKGALKISILLHAVAILFLVAAGRMFPSGILYWIGTGLFSLYADVPAFPCKIERSQQSQHRLLYYKRNSESDLCRFHCYRPCIAENLAVNNYLLIYRSRF